MVVIEVAVIEVAVAAAIEVAEEDVVVATVDSTDEEVHLVAEMALLVEEEGVLVTGRVLFPAAAITTLPGVIAAIDATKLNLLVLVMMMVVEVAAAVDTVVVSVAVVIEAVSEDVAIEVEEVVSVAEEGMEIGTEMVTLVDL